MRLGIALLLLAPLAFGDPLADLGSAAPEIRAAAASRLARVPGPEVSRALAGTLGDREPRVREAALKALGERSDEVSRNALRASLRRFAKDAELLPVAVAALGAARDAPSAGAVAKLLRKAVGSDARLARACIDALGQMPSPDAAAALVDLLGGAAVGEHAEFVGDVRESLRELTGLPFRKDETWSAWWRSARKDWRGAPMEPAAGAAFYRSDGWRFTIEVPSPDRFEITRPEGTAARIRWRGPEEECRFAFLDVLAHATSEAEPDTVAEAAEQYRAVIRRELSHRKDEEYDRSVRFAGAKALRHVATGIFSGGAVARWRVFVLEQNGLLYTVSAAIESGASAAAIAEWESILGSFTLLDR